MQLNCSRQSAVQIGLNPTQVFTKCSRRHNNHYRYQSVESENNQNQWQGRDLHRDLSKEPSRHPDSFSKVKEAATPYTTGFGNYSWLFCTLWVVTLTAFSNTKEHKKHKLLNTLEPKITMTTTIRLECPLIHNNNQSYPHHQFIPSHIWWRIFHCHSRHFLLCAGLDDIPCPRSGLRCCQRRSGVINKPVTSSTAALSHQGGLFTN